MNPTTRGKLRGEFIRAARLRAGLTQANLAKRAYRHVSWVRRLERGEAPLRVDDARDLAPILMLHNPCELQYLNLLTDR